MTTVRRGFAIRLLAVTIDVLLGILVAVLLSRTLGWYFAGRSVVMLSIGSPDTFWRGPIPMVLGYFGTVVYGLPFAMLVVLLPEALFGAAPGKWILALRVTARDGAPASARSRWVRWIAKCSGLWLMVLALILGSGVLAGVAVAAGVAALAGSFLAIGRRREALHDRLAGTAVCSTGGAPR
jgi:uncharacterized RDD family membrane protein YckC